MSSLEMKALVDQYLTQEHSERYWDYDESTLKLLVYLQRGSLFAEDYRPLISRIRRKKPNLLTIEEIEIYLTGLAKADRANDTFSGAIKSGLLNKLLLRWLDLTARSEE